MNEQQQMAEFADNLWQNYIKDKIAQNSSNGVTYFKAEVVTNNGDGTLSVTQPYDNPITVHCTSSLTNITAGTQVVVLCFGKGNSKNYLAISKPWDSFADMGTNVAYFGSCESAADTATKTVDIPELTQIVKGTVVYIRFGATNTATADVALSINGISYPLYKKARNSAYAAIGTIPRTSWLEGEIKPIVFDGTAWVITSPADLDIEVRRIESVNPNGVTSSGKSMFCIVPWFSVSDLGVAVSDRTNYFKALVMKICSMYPNVSQCTFVGKAQPDSQGWYSVYIYNTSTVSNGLPQYSRGNFFSYDQSEYATRFGTSNYAWDYKQFVSTYSGWGITLGTDNETIPSGTTTQKGGALNFSTPGLYLLCVTVSWGSANAGRRTLQIGESTSSVGYINQVIVTSGAGAYCAQQLFTVFNSTGSTSLKVYLYQNSGGALTSIARYGWVRLS